MIIAHSSKSTFGFGTVDWGVGSNIHVDCGVLLTRRHNRKKTAKKYKTSKSCVLIFVNKKLNSGEEEIQIPCAIIQFFLNFSIFQSRILL